MNNNHNNETKPRAKGNLYLTLDLMPGASHNDILHAYNRAKNTYTGGSLASYTLMEGEASQSILEEIESAFLILGNPAKRREYDIKMGFNTWVDEDSPQGVRTPSQPSYFSRQDASSQAQVASFTGSPSENSAHPSGFSVVSSRTVIPMRASTSSLSSSSGLAMAPQQQQQQQPHPQPQAPREMVFKDIKSTPTNFEPNPDFERKIQECTRIDGAFLKAVRIYRCFTVETLAQRTKLSSSHIHSLENEEGDSLYQPVYLRGHIYLVCHALGLPHPDNLARDFLERLIQEGKVTKKLF